MNAEDVPDNELPALCVRHVHDALRLIDRFSNWLLAEHMTTRLQGGLCVRRAPCRICVDAGDVGPGGRKRLVVVAEFRETPKLGADRVTRGRAAADEADDVELRHLVVGASMACAHVAAAGNEHSKRTGHT